MTLEEMLADLFEGRWPRERNGYTLNTALRCRPWWPPLPTVWARREVGPEPGTAGTAYHSEWSKALAMLEQLHGEYLRRAGASHE